MFNVLTHLSILRTFTAKKQKEYGEQMSKLHGDYSRATLLCE